MLQLLVFSTNCLPAITVTNGCQNGIHRWQAPQPSININNNQPFEPEVATMLRRRSGRWGDDATVDSGQLLTMGTMNDGRPP